VLINRLDDRTRGKFVVFGLLAGALFTGIVGTLGATFVWENGAHYFFFRLFGLDPGDIPEGPTTPDLEWPTWIVYSAVPLGSYLMCFRFLQVTASFLRTGQLPHHDHGHVEGIDESPPDLVGKAVEEAEELAHAVGGTRRWRRMFGKKNGGGRQ
jgi:C4-dicarboxylate transporter DctQ subunit